MNSPTKPQGRILVIRGGAFGDFILTTPAISLIRRQFPEVRIELLAYPQYAQLAIESGISDGYRSIDSRPLAGFFARRGVLCPELSQYFRTFHLVLSYLYDPDGIFRENIGRVTSAQFIQGPHRPDESESVHAVDQLLKPLERLAIYDTGVIPHLAVSSEPIRSDTEVIALHPGSGSERKNWPECSWAELIARILDETSAGLLLVGGEAEGDRLVRLASVRNTPRIQLARSLPLPQLARRMSHCLGFLGHDSGVTHFAAALGLPGIVLWGPSNASVWKPRSEKMHLLHSPNGLASRSTQSVWNTLGEQLPIWRASSIGNSSEPS
jgi:heptosyltransferase-2